MKRKETTPPQSSQDPRAKIVDLSGDDSDALSPSTDAPLPFTKLDASQYITLPEVNPLRASLRRMLCNLFQRAPRYCGERIEELSANVAAFDKSMWESGCSFRIYLGEYLTRINALQQELGFVACCTRSA